MVQSLVFLCKSSRNLPSLFTFHRSMGGGPRSFPGGLNKWQWKRMHEKKAREKEKVLLDHEKQLYQSRIRSQIRSKIVASDDVPSSSSSNSQPTHIPLSPEEQIKALADRFMKEGAEDLWNEDDGPVTSSVTKSARNKIVSEPIDLRKLAADNPGSSIDVGNLSSFTKSRHFSSSVTGSVMHLKGGYRGLVSMNSIGVMNIRCYSTGKQIQKAPKRVAPKRVKFTRNESSESEVEGGLRKQVPGRKGRYPRFAENASDISVDDDDSDLDEKRCRGKRMMSSTALIQKAPKWVAPKRVKFTRNESSESEDDASGEDEGGFRKPVPGTKGRYPRFAATESDISGDDDDSDSDLDGKRGRGKRMMSSAALGKYDRITTKRVPLQLLEKEYDLSSHVEEIRKEYNRRTFKGNGGVKSEEQEEESFLSSKRFDECDISPLTVKALTAAGYVQMTRVQEAALTACLEGNDVMVKAKTGTGKSAAFLLPAIETVIKASKKNSELRISPAYALIICPTRELASQIAAEATVLLKYHDEIGVLTLVGGTRFKFDQLRLESEPSQIIVATPGRLLDHIENKSGFSVRLMGLKMLILDEADHLLDLGFRKDIEKIIDCLPRQRRQSLLFSATMPKEVRRVCQLVLKRDHAYIDTVGLSGLDTNAQVRQAYLVAPHVEHFQIVHHLLQKHISEVADYKVIVFCSTSMMTTLMFSLLREMKLNVIEMHSKKPQIARTRISEEFKESKRLVMITSDVSSRGMNYPDVTLVIQVGIPPDREQYIHRLGRTGREGKAGAGVLLLAPWEEYFLDEIKDLPLGRTSPPLIETHVNAKMKESMSKIDTSIKEAAYHAWLGYYNSIDYIGRDKTTLVGLANSFSESIGLKTPPSLFRKTALKMGLKDIPGIRIRK